MAYRRTELLREVMKKISAYYGLVNDTQYIAGLLNDVDHHIVPKTPKPLLPKFKMADVELENPAPQPGQEE